MIFDRLLSRLQDALARQSEAPELLFSNLPTLETPRLVLRKMTMQDAADIFEYAQDERMTKYVLWDAHKTIADSREYLRCMRRMYRDGMPSSYGIVLKETNKVIGTIGFMSYSPDNRCAEVGYSLGAAYWNKGLATEALRAVLDMS
ncbi:MAG: GNAT family N-acetyltransferase, partial [Clostridia bacterium]|nr:GNAT family N-acetyltransferase [Clostridia bacterium]